MQLWKVTQDELAAIVQDVSAEQYGGNIRVGEGMQGGWVTRGKRVQHVVFGLRVNSSQGPGHRRSAGGLSPSKRPSGGVLARSPRHHGGHLRGAPRSADSRTALADYRGGDDFREAFPDTYYSNISAA